MDQRLLEEYQKELSKNKIDLDKSKNEIIEQLSQWKKDDIFEKKIEKITLWMRIKKVLGF